MDHSASATGTYESSWTMTDERGNACSPDERIWPLCSSWWSARAELTRLIDRISTRRLRTG